VYWNCTVSLVSHCQKNWNYFFNLGYNILHNGVLINQFLFVFICSLIYHHKSYAHVVAVQLTVNCMFYWQTVEEKHNITNRKVWNVNLAKKTMWTVQICWRTVQVRLTQRLVLQGCLVSVVAYADGSCGSRVLPVCLSVFFRMHDISKTDAVGARVTKLNTEMFHDESWKPKRSR